MNPTFSAVAGPAVLCGRAAAQAPIPTNGTRPSNGSDVHDVGGPVETDAGRWLVAPYGDVGRVRNARASGEVALECAGRLVRLRLAAVIEPTPDRF